MKAKEIVERIAESKENQKLEKLFEKITEEPESITQEKADQLTSLFKDLLRRILQAKKDYLGEVTKSYGGKASSSSLKNIETAAAAFDRQINEQMPIFAGLLEQAKEFVELKLQIG